MLGPPAVLRSRSGAGVGTCDDGRDAEAAVCGGVVVDVRGRQDVDVGGGGPAEVTVPQAE